MPGRGSRWLLFAALLGIHTPSSYGFRYNYHWLEDDCGRSISLGKTNDSLSLYGFVRVNRDGPYSPGLDCTLTVHAPEDYRLVVRIRRIEIFQPSGSGLQCTHDHMRIIGNSSSLTYCGFGRPSYAVLSSSNFLTFHMFSTEREWINNWIGFDLYYTAFHERDECDESLNDFGLRNEFRCGSGNRCIPGELACDMFDNCGDWSDEQVSTCGLSSGAKIAIGVVCGIVLISIIGFVVFYAYTKKREKELRQRARNGIAPTISADGNGSVNHLPGQAEPPPPYTYSVVYSATPLPPVQENGADPEATSEPPPPAYTESPENRSNATAEDVHVYDEIPGHITASGQTGSSTQPRSEQPIGTTTPHAVTNNQPTNQSNSSTSHEGVSNPAFQA